MDSRESRGGSEQLVCSGSDPLRWDWALAISIAADASAIHRADKADKVSTDDAGVNRTWSEYLMSGPSVWSTVAHPALSSAIESEMWKAIKSDPPPNINAVVQFFLYKQSLDPARFDHYHPRVAASLAKIKAELAQAATPGATPGATTNTATTPTDQRNRSLRQLQPLRTRIRSPSRRPFC